MIISERKFLILSQCGEHLEGLFGIGIVEIEADSHIEAIFRLLDADNLALE